MRRFALWLGLLGVWGATFAANQLPVQVGESWRYFKGKLEPPANWTAVSFADGSWAVGPSGFGYGDGDDATVLSDMAGSYKTVYIRHVFDVAQPQALVDLTLVVDYDDGFVAYLNGTEVARRNVDGNPPGHDASATDSHEAGVPELFSIASALTLLVPGSNVLAIQGHNNGIGSADFSLIPSLHSCGDGNACTTDTLDPESGCLNSPLPAGTSCSDGSACTAGDSCNASGTCVPGPPLNCNDQNPCTNDSCSATQGCLHPPNTGASCSDGSVCTAGDSCNASGACAPGPPLNCNDSNGCTADSCSATQGCLHAPQTGTSCSDGKPCTAGDTCAQGVCVAGPPTVCADSSSCTVDSCHPTQGCQFTPLPAGTACNDGDLCTEGESCNASGQCLVGTPIVCDDLDPCTPDSCDPAQGCLHIASALGPAAVPTFESMSLYFSPYGGGANKPVAVRFRPVGALDWRDGEPLWFDARTSPAPPFGPRGEYRGSLVGLAPNTTYQIELQMAGGPKVLLAAKTWSEEFPIGKTITLPVESSETLTLDESGSPAGYVLYAPAAGSSATIDVAGLADYDVKVKASYVILRGVTLKGARVHAITFSDSVAPTDVVIEDNTISGWGRVDPTGFGIAYDSAIRSDDAPVRRLIIQRNTFENPRGDSNSWCEFRDGTVDPGCATHPEGPHAIRLSNSCGNLVVRYNTVTTDEQHYFSDGFGGGENFSYGGFPGPDSDVYGNSIERCWDNAIEAEGGGCNVRIWGNYIDRTYTPLGLTPVSLGPLYVFRNVADRSRKGPVSASGSSDDDERGRFIKGGGGLAWSGGRVFVYHNTVLQRLQAPSLVFPLGVENALDITSNGGGDGVVSRNNIFEVYSESEDSIVDLLPRGVPNDFDHDLYNGTITSPVVQEAHGTIGKPLFDPSGNVLWFYLSPESPGYDAGLVLPNFNDDFLGQGPELGAFESGAPPLEFGVDAYEKVGTQSPPSGPPATDLDRK